VKTLFWSLLLMLALLRPLAAAAEAKEEPAPAQVMVMLKLPAPHFRAGDNYGGAYRNDSGRSARRKLALELAQAHGLKLVSDWPMPLLGIDCYVLQLPPDQADPERIAALLAADPRVQWAQPVTTYRAMAAGDPLYKAQPTAVQWRLSDLHRAATGRNVRVAVIDSGVDDTHPELAGQVTVKENFIDRERYIGENHGTAVAGIIVARADNGIGIRGVAPDARVLALRACREGAQGAQCDSFSLAKALNFAVMQSPQVINMSLSGPADRLLQKLVEVAIARGIRVVGAADPQLSGGGFPAAWPGVLSVASDPGPQQMAAPGRDIPAPLPGGRYGVLSGSSYAAANVSGVLALMGELRPRSAFKAAPGMLDPCAALRGVAPDCVCQCGPDLSLRNQ
jgi:hypothetical protein